MRSFAMRSLCWCLVITLPASLLFAEARGAMLYGVGARVNGATVTKSSAVLAGDRIVTTSAGAATLAAPQSRVLVAASSSLVYRGASLELSAGTVSVATSGGLVTQVGSLRVVPARNGGAQYDVAMRAGAITVISKQGTLALNLNGTTTMLAAGASWAMDDRGQPQNQDSDRDRKKGAAVVLSGKAIGITAAAVGAAVAVIAIESTKSPASPSSPR